MLLHPITDKSRKAAQRAQTHRAEPLGAALGRGGAGAAIGRAGALRLAAATEAVASLVFCGCCGLIISLIEFLSLHKARKAM